MQMIEDGIDRYITDTATELEIDEVIDAKEKSVRCTYDLRKALTAKKRLHCE
ncbi:hypothetical protein CHS0354_024359, partial [Potamilus streckersoni]